MSLRFISEKVEDTDMLGAIIGEAAQSGLVVTLQGDLGAGKTHLTKGIARGLGVPNPRYVSSPTFTIHKVYKGRIELHHLDFYRLDDDSDPLELGIEETLGLSGVCVIEWPDNFFSHIGDKRLAIRINILDGERREILVDWQGELAERVGKALESAVGKG